MDRPRVRTMVPADLARLGGIGTSHGQPDVAVQDPATPWALAAQQRWGFCGILVVDDDRTVAAGLVSPALTLPRAHPLARCAKAPDVAYLLALAVDPARDGAHMARLVAQGLARHLTGQATAVEAACREGSTSATEPPVQWLLAAGFRPVTPSHGGGGLRVRLDVDSPVRWPTLDRAWELLAGLVPRPAASPGATGRDAG